MPTADPQVDLNAFVEKIDSTEAAVGIVGLGYVGLPVALSFAEAGFRVHGVDVDEVRIDKLNAGKSYLGDVASGQIERHIESGRFCAATSYDELAGADAILISVPTPLIDGAPDLSLVVSAGQSVASVIRPNSLVVLESTTYPGTTQDLLAPLLEESGLRAGHDFFLAFSPERIDPGNELYDFSDIPKVVGGIDENSTKAATKLYESVLTKVFPVSSPKEAELAKLIENTFRHVNIALVNELAVCAHDMGVDIWESIEAAATKPFGFMPFWPGPGWGGHCIPLDPAYLSYRVRKDHAHEVRFVELAHEVNSEMPRHVVGRASLLLNREGKAVKGARILGVGVAYKGGTEDTRGAPGLKVLDQLAKQGAKVSYLDPLVPQVTINGAVMTSVGSVEDVSQYDLVITLIPQHDVDWERISKNCRLALDCCRVLLVTDDRVERL